MFDLKEMAREYLSANQTTFGHDRSKTVGSSEIGTCARKVAYDKLGTVADVEYVENVGFTGRGNVIEDAFAVPLLEYIAGKLGGTLLFAGQKNQVSLVAQGVPLSATPDGLIVNVPRNALSKYGVEDLGESKSFSVEIKSLDDRYNKGKLPKPAHTPQVITALGLLRRATEYRPDFGLLLYVDTSDYTEIDGFTIAYSEASFQGLARRANKIMSAKDANEFHPEGKIQGGSDCKYCRHAKKCLGYLPYLPNVDAQKIEPKTLTVVEKRAVALNRAETAVSKAAQKKLDAEAKLVAALTQAGSKFVVTPKAKVIWKATASQDRSDAAAMKARLIELGEDVTKFVKPTKPGTSVKVEMVH